MRNTRKRERRGGKRTHHTFNVFTKNPNTNGNINNDVEYFCSNTYKWKLRSYKNIMLFQPKSKEALFFKQISFTRRHYNSDFYLGCQMMKICYNTVSYMENRVRNLLILRRDCISKQQDKKV